MNRAWRGCLSAVGAAMILSGSAVALAEGPAVPPAAGRAPVLTPPVASGCVKDVECKGDRICVEGRCVSPAPAATPPTPAPMVVPAAAPPAAPPVSAPPPVAPPAPLLPPPPPPPAVEVVPPPRPPTTIVVYAPPPPDVLTPAGPSFGLRFGVGLPAGNVSPGAPASAVVGYLLPVTLDIGYRLNPHWYIGGYLSVAYGTSPPSTCAVGGNGVASCYETDIRLGLDVQYRFLPSARLQPWVGVGAGWEVLNDIATDDAGDEESDSKNGVEVIHLDLGVDYRVGLRDKLGVYFLSTVSDLDDSSVHAWFMFGGRWRHDMDTFQRY